MKCFEYHRGGDGFFERSVVHESLKAALVEFFAGEVKPDGAAVVKKVDVEILRYGIARRVGLWGMGSGFAL